MKRLLLIMVLSMLVLLSISPYPVLAESEKDLSSMLTSHLEKIDFDAFDEFIDQYLGDSDTINSSVKDYVKSIISGDFDVRFGDIMNIIGRHVLSDVLGFLPIIVIVIGIAVLYSLVDSMSSKLSSSSVREIIYFVSYVTIIVAIMAVLVKLVSDATRVINGIHSFMTIIFPVELTLMSALGGNVTVSSLQPLLASLVFIVSGIVAKVVMPIFLSTIVFSIVGNLSANIRLDKITKATKSVGEFVLGGIFSIFTGLMLIQGVTGSTIDGVSIKSAKFAINSYVPILGGYLSDGFDVAMASIVLIKNSVGYVGIVIILMLVLAPVIKITIFSLTLRLASGIIEPISDSRMSDILYTISTNTGLLVAMVLGSAFMFLMVAMFIILSLNVVV